MNINSNNKEISEKCEKESVEEYFVKYLNVNLNLINTFEFSEKYDCGISRSNVS